MRFPFYIAKRYLFSKSKNNAINIITIIAAVGVFAGALALFIVLSGFSGLKAFSVQYTNDIDPDLKVVPLKGKVFTLDSTKAEQLHQYNGIEVYSKIIEERVLLGFENRSMPALIKGVDGNFNQVTSTYESIVAGYWFDQNKPQVVMGMGISRKLNMGLSGYGEILELRVPKPGKGIITDPTKAFTTSNTIPVGVYSINEEMNDKYIYAPLSLARELLNLNEGEVSALEIKLNPGTNEREAKSKIADILGNEVVVKNRIELNDELYKMLNTENLAVYLIFTLVLIIALFNVGGAIVMSILDKRDNIKTLFNLGAGVRDLRRIFFLQGSLLTFFGGVMGLGIGVIVVLLQQNFSWVMISESLAYPVLLRFENLVIVFVTIMILGLAASYIGSTRINKALKAT